MYTGYLRYIFSIIYANSVIRLSTSVASKDKIFEFLIVGGEEQNVLGSFSEKKKEMLVMI